MPQCGCKITQTISKARTCSKTRLLDRECACCDILPRHLRASDRHSVHPTTGRTRPTRSIRTAVKRRLSPTSRRRRLCARLRTGTALEVSFFRVYNPVKSLTMSKRGKYYCENLRISPEIGAGRNHPVAGGTDDGGAHGIPMGFRRFSGRNSICVDLVQVVWVVLVCCANANHNDDGDVHAAITKHQTMGISFEQDAVVQLEGSSASPWVCPSEPSSTAPTTPEERTCT